MNKFGYLAMIWAWAQSGVAWSAGEYDCSNSARPNAQLCICKETRDPLNPEGPPIYSFDLTASQRAVATHINQLPRSIPLIDQMISDGRLGSDDEEFLRDRVTRGRLAEGHTLFFTYDPSAATRRGLWFDRDVEPWKRIVFGTVDTAPKRLEECAYYLEKINSAFVRIAITLAEANNPTYVKGFNIKARDPGGLKIAPKEIASISKILKMPDGKEPAGKTEIEKIRDFIARGLVKLELHARIFGFGHIDARKAPGGKPLDQTSHDLGFGFDKPEEFKGHGLIRGYWTEFLNGKVVEIPSFGPKWMGCGADPRDAGLCMSRNTWAKSASGEFVTGCLSGGRWTNVSCLDPTQIQSSREHWEKHPKLRGTALAVVPATLMDTIVNSIQEDGIIQRPTSFGPASPVACESTRTMIEQLREANQKTRSAISSKLKVGQENIEALKCAEHFINGEINTNAGIVDVEGAMKKVKGIQGAECKLMMNEYLTEILLPYRYAVCVWENVYQPIREQLIYDYTNKI